MRVIGLAGWSGSGKTTLLARLLPELIRRGFSVSTMKHAHHEFDVDQPGKDSWRHRSAGATEVLVASAKRWALMHEHRGGPEPRAAELMKQMTPDMLGQWLVALSEQSVDDAVQTIRKTVASIELAQRNTPVDGKRG